MIAKILTGGKGITGKVNYLFEGRLEDRKSVDKKAQVITHSNNISVPYGQSDKRARVQLIADFRDQANKHRKPENYVGEHVLSFSKLDSDFSGKGGKLKNVVDDYVKEMGLTNTQFLALSHKDTDIFHVHLLYNNIDNEGKKRNVSFEKLKASTMAAVITRRHGLDYSKLSPKVTNSKYYHQSRAKDADIIELKSTLKSFGLGESRNQLHLSKIGERLNVEVKEIDKNFIQIGEKQFLKMDLNTVFHSNRNDMTLKASAKIPIESKETQSVGEERIAEIGKSRSYIELEPNFKKPKVKDHIRKIKKHKAKAELRKDKQIKR